MSTKKIQILGSLGDKIYKQNEEPIDAQDGTLWIDMDAEGDVSSGGTSVLIDTTLKQSGWAADAKAVGDAINTKVPTTRTINGKALSSNIVLTADDIGITTETDDTLAIEGVAADAKAVGDALAGKQPIGDYASTSDLETLVGTTKVSDQISGATTTDSTLTVQLGANGTVGGYKTGDVIAEGTDIKTILNKLFQKAVPATYTTPKLILVGNSTSGHDYEYGTNITSQVKATFKQNDAGALESISILKNGTEILTGTTSPLISTAEEIHLTTTISYTASATYAEGAIKNNNLGEASPDGHIEASTVTSNAVTFTPYRQGYFYGVLKSAEPVVWTSNIIRSGTMKNGSYASGDLPLISASSVEDRTHIFVACPATNKGVTKVIMPSAVNADCTADFVKQSSTVTVEGANGADGIAYNLWVYSPASISDDQTFTVTLG